MGSTSNFECAPRRVLFVRLDCLLHRSGAADAHLRADASGGHTTRVGRPTARGRPHACALALVCGRQGCAAPEDWRKATKSPACAWKRFKGLVRPARTRRARPHTALATPGRATLTCTRTLYIVAYPPTRGPTSASNVFRGQSSSRSGRVRTLTSMRRKKRTTTASCRRRRRRCRRRRRASGGTSATTWLAFAD